MILDDLKFSIILTLMAHMVPKSLCMAFLLLFTHTVQLGSLLNLTVSLTDC